jgi:threonine dehydratase
VSSGSAAWSAIDILSAERRIKGEVVRTPLVRAPPRLETPSTAVYLKLENLQHAGSFKIRGATNKIATLSAEQRERGVITASAGNHAQGVAWAARRFGNPATIVMAERASPLKVRMTQALGARVILYGADYDEAYDRAVTLGREEGLAFIHPYDDPEIIAGQATVGREILEDLPDVRRVIAGVGGGGLLAGIASALRQAGSDAEVVGVQPTGASTLAPSLDAGHVILGPRPATFADGIATRHLGELPFQILKQAHARAVVVDDRTLARAVFLLLEQAKLVAEAAGAAALAAVLADPDLLDDGPVALVVSGGNLDPFVLGRILSIGLAADGRILRLRVSVKDVPGRLAEFLQVAAEARANVRHIVHARESTLQPPGEVTIELELEVRDAVHRREVLQLYRDRGWTVEEIPLGDGQVTPRAS